MAKTIESNGDMDRKEFLAKLGEALYGKPREGVKYEISSSSKMKKESGKMLYFDKECKEGWSIEDVEKIRDQALNLVYQDMHPRYDLIVKDLFKAANALMNEMKMDESRSFGTGQYESQQQIVSKQN